MGLTVMTKLDVWLPVLFLAADCMAGHGLFEKLWHRIAAAPRLIYQLLITEYVMGAGKSIGMLMHQSNPQSYRRKD